MTTHHPRMDILSRRIHLITGKGGVGRTTVAAALAVAAASRGKRVLLTEIGDPEGGFSAIGRKFGREHLTPDPEPLGPSGLRGCHVWATRGHELFAHSVVPAGPLIRAALRSRTLRKFVAAVPSLYELGVFYHLLALLQAEHADGGPEHEVIVADMPATGHTLALMRLPEILLDALPDGPIPRYMREGQAYLNDPAKGVAWVVALPELLPVTEALDLIDGLRETKVEPAGVILNRMPDDPFDPEERRELAAILAEQPMHGALGFQQMGASCEAGKRLRAGTDVPIIELPDLPEPADGRPSALLSELCLRLADLMETT
ncbi:MAG: AAA family ATPase [Deltaproteobacteria bacterium]|nr:AAA family ATPase [Deltaproteobacteria bacterium]MBW2417840.1 AAA family ATPase [Deltaproteobacteria bacterium]